MSNFKNEVSEEIVKKETLEQVVPKSVEKDEEIANYVAVVDSIFKGNVVLIGQIVKELPSVMKNNKNFELSDKVSSGIRVEFDGCDVAEAILRRKREQKIKSQLDYIS